MLLKNIFEVILFQFNKEVSLYSRSNMQKYLKLISFIIFLNCILKLVVLSELIRVLKVNYTNCTSRKKSQFVSQVRRLLDRLSEQFVFLYSFQVLKTIARNGFAPVQEVRNCRLLVQVSNSY